MKTLKMLICLITVLAVAAAFSACAEQVNPDAPASDAPAAPLPEPAEEAEIADLQVYEAPVYEEPIVDLQPEEGSKQIIPEEGPFVDIYATTDLRLGFISSSFIDLVDYDEFMEWVNSTSSSVSEYTSVAEAANLYSFIKRFEIPDDKVREILISERNGNEDEDFSDDDIEILLSGDNEAIAEHFAADTAIRKGENLYSIYWMQNHTAEDYAAAGITDEDIAAIPALAEALQKQEQ